MFRGAVRLCLVLVSLVALDADIRKTDFANFSYPLPSSLENIPDTFRWLPVSGLESVRITDGRYSFNSAPRDFGQPSPSLRLLNSVFGDLDGDKTDEAVVVLRYSTGGTANWSYLYVYKLEHDRPKLLALLESGSRARQGLINVRIQNEELILDFADPNHMTADCCSDGYVRIRYRWTTGKFVQIGSAEQGVLERAPNK